MTIHKAKTDINNFFSQAGYKFCDWKNFLQVMNAAWNGYGFQRDRFYN